jgi:hypothetical protein
MMPNAYDVCVCMIHTPAHACVRVCVSSVYACMRVCERDRSVSKRPYSQPQSTRKNHENTKQREGLACACTLLCMHTCARTCIRTRHTIHRQNTY